jgi:hypothetical protein
MKFISTKTILGVLFLFFGSFSLQVSSVEMESLPQSKKVKLTLKTSLKDPKILVVDEQEGILLEQPIISDKAFVEQIIDLTNLPKGRYDILVKSVLKEIIQPIQLTDHECIIKDYLRQEHYTPMLVQNEGYFDISWVGHRIGSFTLTLLDKSGYIVFKNESKNVLRVQKRFRIDRMAKGDYTVKMTTSYRTYYDELRIR